jgi:AraC-like DNA-binding protein
MKYWYQKPHKHLTDYLRTVLILEGFSASAAVKLPILTNGVSALICRTEKDESGNEQVLQLALFGTSIPAGVLSLNQTTTVIVYFFKPFALTTMFNVAAARLMKSPVELSQWSPHQTNAIKTQLSYAGSTTSKIKILDNLLTHQLEQQHKECGIIKFATDEMMMNTGKEILAALLNKLNVNERTFQRMFKKYVGITAGQYRRICQFQLSFAQLRAKKFEKLTDIAFENGFADQSHFIRSFKEFTKITPNDYLKSGLKSKNG